MSTGSGLEWLSRAAELQACPLCVAAREFESEYLRDFCRSVAQPGRLVAEFVRGPGFCLDHATKFEQAVLRGDASVTDAADLYLATLESVVQHVSDLEEDEWLKTTECPMCVSRDQQMVIAVQAFIAAVEHVPWAVAETLRAGGLCVGHFAMAWVASEQAADRSLLREVQWRATADLEQHLRELRVGQAGDGSNRGGELIEAWKRAARSVSGWTATRR
jgi:hypothetical protein